MNLTRLSGVLLAVALPFAVSGVASAGPEHTMTLTLETPDGPATSVELVCDPAGGDHPNAAAACDELLAARGDFDALPGDQQLMNCTMEYRPVTAVAEGTWAGDDVEWEQEFGNACALRGATGTVFRF